MEDIKLPRHVISTVERRWMNKLEQAACAWKREQRASVFERSIVGDGRRDVPVVVRRAGKRSANPGRQPSPSLGEQKSLAAHG